MRCRRRGAPCRAPTVQGNAGGPKRGPWRGCSGSPLRPSAPPPLVVPVSCVHYVHRVIFALQEEGILRRNKRQGRYSYTLSLTGQHPPSNAPIARPVAQGAPLRVPKGTAVSREGGELPPTHISASMCLF